MRREGLPGLWEGDVLETNPTLTTGEAVGCLEEEMHPLKKKHSVERQVSQKDSDTHARGKTNNSLKGFIQNDNEQSHSRRPYKKEGRSAAETTHEGNLLVGKADRKDYMGSMEGKRSERYMKELLNREANQDGAGRVNLETAKSRDQRSEIARKGNPSARLPDAQRGVLQGNRNIVRKYQPGKNFQEAPLQVEGRPTKLKLKVGGITHTLQTFLPAQKVDSRKGSEVREATKPELKKRRQRLILQGISDDEDIDILPADNPRERSTKQQSSVLKNSSLPKKVEDGGACSRSDPVFEQMGSTRHGDRNLSASPSGQPLRKSSRVVKKRVFDVEEDDAPETEKKRRRRFKGDDDELYEDEDNENAAISEGEASSDADVNSLDDDEHGSRKSFQKMKGQLSQVAAKKKKEASLTARQRALQSCKERDIDPGTSLIEFPDGLPSSIPRKQKAKLTEEETQAKKAEAAMRRKQQIEKAAKDIQASAIQKILCQDSVRKKREDRLQKQREEIAQSKKAAELEVASNSIRWIFGPNGTVVSWSKDVELPTLFKSGPSSYPPPREKCAVPTCNNAYKYRHSKLKLPLCSLECYRIVEAPSKIGSAF
ncbi:hypothetical protein O6H91_05G114100 [Diphasiastrum complanatum]|uniref:Uncharacterized protein n=1 Tax=Diphasiastrum complanatum TaxID=34168 RepID=A0ACC2DSA3_DIPCM|nr:hypothetical protein O6H91_05G114100 [Diphasiastrum complanatum]